MEEKKDPLATHYKLPWWLTSLAKTLNFTSKRLTTRFLWKIFCSPIKFKTPSREADFYNNTEQEKVETMSVKKSIMLYRRPNDGPKLLFVHGWNGRSSQFYRIIDLLSENGYDITSIDLPGHGRSSRSSTNLPEIIDLVAEMMEASGPYFGVVCHSFGGVAALNALRHGATCEKLVLISPGMYDVKPTFEGFVGLFGLDEVSYGDRIFALAESIHGINPGALGLDRFADQIETETLIVHCEDDKDSVKEIALDLHADMKHSTLHLTQGLGHRRILRDEKVAEMVRDFL